MSMLTLLGVLSGIALFSVAVGLFAERIKRKDAQAIYATAIDRVQMGAVAMFGAALLVMAGMFVLWVVSLCWGGS